MMTRREGIYDPSEGEFVDFETLADWEARDNGKDAHIKTLEAQVKAADALAKQVQRVKDFRYDPNIGIELNLLETSLAAYCDVKEGGA